MDIVFQIKDKTGKLVYLTKERHKHILKHPKMHDQIDVIKDIIRNPTIIRFNEDDVKVIYYYKDYKPKDKYERYLLV